MDGIGSEQSAADASASAQQIYDTIKLLWDDQVDLAATLRDRRKLYATLVVAVGAVGALRIEWSRRPGDVSPFLWSFADWVVRGTVVTGVVCLIIACRWIFFEGSRKRDDEPEVIVIKNGDLTKPLDPEDAGEVSSEIESSRALAVTDIDEVGMERLSGLPPYAVWLERAGALRAAYADLVVDNNRVKDRLRLGMLWLGGGYFLLAVAVLTYTVSTSPRSRESGYGQSPKASQVEGSSRGFSGADAQAE